MSELQLPIQFTDAAANKVLALVTEEENPELKLRVYITGGGCSGFQYGFTFDEKVNEGDLVVEKKWRGHGGRSDEPAVSGRWCGRLH